MFIISIFSMFEKIEILNILQNVIILSMECCSLVVPTLHTKSLLESYLFDCEHYIHVHAELHPNESLQNFLSCILGEYKYIIDNMTLSNNDVTSIKKSCSRICEYLEYIQNKHIEKSNCECLQLLDEFLENIKKLNS